MRRTLLSLSQLGIWSILFLLLYVSDLPAQTNQMLATMGDRHSPSYQRQVAETQSISLEAALKDLQAQFGVTLSYPNTLVAGKQALYQQGNASSLDKALREVLTPNELAHKRIRKNYYIIFHRNSTTPRSREVNVEKVPPRFDAQGLSSMHSASVAPRIPAAARLYTDQTITGQVFNEEGNPLSGATVIAKGTTRGANTDEKGEFSLTLANDVTTLRISYYGYETQEVEIDERSVIKIIMKASEAFTDEVVVVGYGTQKKSDLTGSLASVSSKDFETQPLTRVDQALQGRAAGVQVTQTSGAPGAGFKIRVRGANSISGSNAPLYVVDGLVVGDINAININDVASMEVLKDASATAVYGSRGANGVVLITTKSGQQGPPKIEFQTFAGVANVFQTLNTMTPAEFAEGVNFAEEQEFYSQEKIDSLRTFGGENWQERFFNPAQFYNAQLSVSGGNSGIRYYLSGNFYDAEGTVINQRYRRYALRSNINATVSPRLTVGLNAYVNREENEGARVNLFNGLTWDPTTPAFNEDGEYNFAPLIAGVGNGTQNPLVAPENNTRENFEHQIIASTYANFKLIDNLELNVSGGVEWRDINNNGYTPRLVNNLGRATVLNRNILRIQNTNRLTYTLDSNPNHRLKIDAVHEQQYIARSVKEVVASDFVTDLTTYKNLSLASVLNLDEEGVSDESLQSFLGRVNYTLFDRFFLTASVRADGASKFRAGQRWGTFPSGSIAWRISDESFLQGVTFLDNLKMRVSYGQIGNQGIASLATRSRSVIDQSVNYPFSGAEYTIGIAPSNRLANENLTWETTTQVNGGIDLGLWGSRITLSVDFYQKNTTDLLLDRILPSYVGPTRIAQNVGEVQNRGFDVVLGSTLADNEDWRLSSTLSISRNQNLVVSLIDDQEIIELGNVYYTNTFPVNPTAVQLGMPISTFRGYQFEGVYQLGEEEEAAIYGKEPGDARYLDVNGDSAITTDDLVTVGDGNPDFTWGWNWTVGWKNLDLSFLLIGSHGNDIYNFTRMRMMGLGAQQFHATHADYNDRWTSENPSDIPAGRDGTEFLSSQFVEDGSFVSMKNLTLGYNFNNAWNRIGLSTIRFYASVENLFILTNYTGFDPESTASGGSDVDLGIDLNTYPLSRSYSLGLNLTF